MLGGEYKENLQPCFLLSIARVYADGVKWIAAEYLNGDPDHGPSEIDLKAARQKCYQAHENRAQRIKRGR